MGPTPSRRRLAALALALGARANKRPNLLLALVDDLGSGDVQYNDPAMVTPELNQLARDGVILDRFYAAATCTPARAALMTGRLGIRTGMQDSVIHATEPRGVPLDEVFLGEKLRRAGYRTAMVGKWHLGFHEAAYTPLKRGFETWYGIFPGGGSHTGHFSVSQPFSARGGADVTWSGFNLWDNTEPSADNQSPTHTTHLYTAKAKEYIEAFEAAAPAHAAPPRKAPRRLGSRDPWFLYLSYQAVHDPVEVGDAKYVTGTNCQALDAPRSELCGMVAEVDDGLKTIRLTLEEHNAWDRTLLVVASDNGGVPAHGSSNYGLRGEKAQYYEGGVRVPLVVSGGYVHKQARGRRLQSLAHVTDLHATFLHLAQYQPRAEDKALDGINLAPHLFGDAPPPRDEVLINMNSAHFGEAGALIVGDFKYATNAEPSEAGIYAHVRKALAKGSAPLENLVAAARDEVVGATTPTLFNIAKNPNERTDCGTEDVEESCDLYDHPAYVEVREALERRWAQYRSEMVESTFAWADDGPLADPALFDGVWAPWRDKAGPRATYAGLASGDAAELVASPKATPGSSMMVTTVAVGLLSFVLGASLSRWKRPRHAYLPIAEDY